MGKITTYSVIKPFFLIISILIVANAYSQNSEYKLDLTNPISVVNGLIFAAKTKNVELISIVFDPLSTPSKNEMYSNRMVYFTKDSNIIQQAYDFRNSFINGEVQISENGDRAYIPIYHSTKKGGFQDKIILKNRYGNWYIAEF
jgi:hypothetical protein